MSTRACDRGDWEILHMRTMYGQGWISHRLDWASAQGHQPLTASGGHLMIQALKFCYVNVKLLRDHTLLVNECHFHKNNNNNNKSRLHDPITCPRPPNWSDLGCSTKQQEHEEEELRSLAPGALLKKTKLIVDTVPDAALSATAQLPHMGLW